MESGFTNEDYHFTDDTWQKIPHRGSGRFEFFKVRNFGALMFAKRPKAAFIHDLVTTESLKKEFFIGFNLNHPSIVKYLKMENGTIFEEYVDGNSLREMIDNGDIRLRSPYFLEDLCRSLLEATAYMHSHGVIHNDIKPENVMISRIDNQVKIIDLGAATSDMWDATGGFTPAYRAPEQGMVPTNVYTDIFLIGRLMEQLAPIAQVADLWKGFVKKATYPNVSGRFYSDLQALYAIPSLQKTQRRKNVFVIAFGVFLFIGCILFSIKLDDEDTQSVSQEGQNYVATEENISSKDANSATEQAINEGMRLFEESAVSEGNIPKAIEEGKALFDQANQDIYDDMRKRISRYTEVQFKKRVFPKCRLFAKMPEGSEKDKFGESIDSLMKSIMENVYYASLKTAEPYGQNEYYYYALACFKASMEEQYDRADSIKYPPK